MDTKFYHKSDREKWMLMIKIFLAKKNHFSRFITAKEISHGARKFKKALPRMITYQVTVAVFTHCCRIGKLT
jgi:hypothetical protein